MIICCFGLEIFTSTYSKQIVPGSLFYEPKQFSKKIIMGQFHQNLIEVMLENRLRNMHKSQKLNVSENNLCPAIYNFYNKMITGTKIRLLQSILLLVRS